MNFLQLEKEICDEIGLIIARYWNSANLAGHQPEPNEVSPSPDCEPAREVSGHERPAALQIARPSDGQTLAA